MYHRELSEEVIIRGFRTGDADIIREYFYGYCQAGCYICDQRYGLSEKENLDFMSLAHQYAIYLMEHDWKPLEDHSPGVSLKTWLIGGFHPRCLPRRTGWRISCCRRIGDKQEMKWKRHGRE